jgi:hypothetical protein
MDRDGKFVTATFNSCCLLCGLAVFLCVCGLAVFLCGLTVCPSFFFFAFVLIPRLKKAILHHQNDLRTFLARLLIREGVQHVEALLPAHVRDQQGTHAVAEFVLCCGFYFFYPFSNFILHD